MTVRKIFTMFLGCIVIFALLGFGIALSQVVNLPISEESSSVIAFDWEGNFADGTAGATATQVQLEFAPNGGGAPTLYTETRVVPVWTSRSGWSGTWRG